MMKKVLLAAVLVTGGLALGSPFVSPSSAAPPAKKPPAADYAMASTVPSPKPANRATCYNDADLAVMRSRMLHQELVVGVLQCQLPGGARAFEAIYTNYLHKFGGELGSNAAAFKTLAGRKRL